MVRFIVRKYIGRMPGVGDGSEMGGKMGNQCLMGSEFQFRKVKNLGDG